MRFGYSAQVDAFYLLDEETAYKKSGTWREDIIPVSDEMWLKFISQPPEGKQRGPGKDGLPAWVDIPEQEGRTIEENQSIKNALLERADTEIRMLTVVQDVYGLNEEEKQKLNDWKKHLAEVYRVSTGVEEKVNWPDAPDKG
ncbi:MULTISPECIES: tail assembly chaperone [Pantoea]|uniref:tail fiber assembly protein n=1 Tax=Pantoea TaxID=53335 RepID=UPI0006894ECB|nr:MULTISPECIES: tail assembly chaperone [Pantoea]